MLKRQRGVCRHEQRFGRASFLYHIGAREAQSCHLLWARVRHLGRAMLSVNGGMNEVVIFHALDQA